MNTPRLALSATILAVASSLLLAGCSTSYPSIAGVWKASDGTASKTVSDDGNCTNMLYRAGQFVGSNTPGMCRITGTGNSGGYILEVRQKIATGESASETYDARFSHGDKTLELSQGGKTIVTLTQASSVD